jgi:hypothetical protein
MQWLMWAEINLALFFGAFVVTGLRRASDKSYAVEQRLNNFFANGGEIAGNVTFDNDVIIGGNLDGEAGMLFIGTSVTLSGATNLTTGNDVVVGGNLAVTGSVDGNLDITNDCVVGGNVDCSKTVNAVQNFVRNGTTLTVP